MNNDSFITESEGLFVLNLHPCTCAILKFVVDPDVEVIWIRRHMPHRYVEWWQAPVLLAPKGRVHEIEIRGLEFDLQVPTKLFLELLNEFEDHGITLFQMTRRVPNTLDLCRVPEEAAASVLIKNGLHLAFYLPHANEVAQIESPNRATLERLLQIPGIKERAIRSSARE